ncbi:MAG: hypothetical protein HKO65_01585 [Gemmatimonadetes bacterium]|nr:hypothetical protein [Gemmatimonadota bacterium]NNM03766.1 hypothetical protein [Gemmatimonadota bacterium]
MIEGQPDRSTPIPPIGGQNETGPLHRVLLKSPVEAYPPTPELDSQWRQLGYKTRPDAEAAKTEHQALCRILGELGAEVEYLPAHPDTNLDSIYTRDASILTNDGMILCNMGKDARQGEPGAQGEAFVSMGIPVLGKVEGEGRIEGGDFVWLDESTAVVGRGYRTNEEGIRQLKALLASRAEEVMVVPLPHWRGPSDVFHLMSIISPVDRDLALVYSPLLPIPFRELLLARGVTLIEVAQEEFGTMAGNVLAVAPRICLMLDGNPTTQGRLEDAGVEVHTYLGAEISHPGEGGPTCLTRPILRGK